MVDNLRNGDGIVGNESLKNGWHNRVTAATGGGGNAWASSDLTTGQLRIESNNIGTSANRGGVITTSLTRMGDVLALVNNSGTDQRVSFGYSFDGGFVGASGTCEYGYVHMSIGSASGLALVDSGVRMAGSGLGITNTTELHGDGSLMHSSFSGTAADRDTSFFGDLPQGVSFRSQSGVSLTGLDNTAVPEPATWALALLPLGLMAVRRRKAA